MIWLDLAIFLGLLGLLLYIYITSAVTVLHRIYLLLHVLFMLWPLFQFAAQTADGPQFKLFYLSASYVALSLLGLGWFVFILFLTARSYFIIRKSVLFLLSLPALLSVLMIVWNHNHHFLDVYETLESGIQQEHGPLFWIMVGQLTLYMSVSIIILLYKLKNGEASSKHRDMIWTAFNSVFLLSFSAVLDFALNILLIGYIGRFIPVISIGLMLTALYIVHAIIRSKVFDIIQIAQQDVMNTMSTGIIVLDENNRIIEVNKAIKHIFRFHFGDMFNPAMLSGQFKGETKREFQRIFDEMEAHPLERLEFEIMLKVEAERHIIMQSAPILDRKKKMLGRVLTFQDVTELRRLVVATNQQNIQLQDQNTELLNMQDKLYQANKQLEQMAVTDSLTGCFNRRYLLEQLEKEVVDNIRYGIPFSLFIFDLDYFKTVNDKYGHLAGDEVLCSTVDTVRSVLRLTDVLARLGGEEFAVYLPHTNREQAEIIAERVKNAVEHNRISSDQCDSDISITISMGVVSIDRFHEDCLFDSKRFLRGLMAQADAALYEAKYNGRNCVVKRKLA
ncbi:histidine kinase N-terminal 7TM domain-containing diguanylate cyclase [Paenibacillus chungangensis]|uniref:Diguanylate cyclase n=1 Tax=Paenibacillus chungangensis TaxID=696535 RepID=A0ABW3HTQ3_9BACL